MASDIASTLTRLSEKSRFLTERFKVVTRQRDEALERIATLQAELDSCKRRLEQLRIENEYLKVSSVLAPSAESVNATRATIKGIIAEIDRIMVDLKD